MVPGHCHQAGLSTAGRAPPADGGDAHAVAAQSLSKGSRVVVVGRLQQRSWTVEDGSARAVVEVVAEELGPSLRWATATPVQATQNATTS